MLVGFGISKQSLGDPFNSLKDLRQIMSFQVFSTCFLLLLSLDGQAKVLDLAERRCLCRASLKDLCEPSLLQLDDALQMSFLDFGRVFGGGTFMIRCFHVCCWIVDGILI